MYMSLRGPSPPASSPPEGSEDDASRHPSKATFRNVQRFRGGLVVKAHRLLYHSTLGLTVIKKKRR